MQRSKISQLPTEVREWLDAALIEGNFSGYAELVEELRVRGCEISKSSLHRYGQEFESRLAALKLATEQARAIAREAGDDEGALNDALIRVAQQKIFELLIRLNTEGDESSLVDLSVAVSKLSKASVDQKKWQAEVRRKVEEKFRGLEKEAAGPKSGLDMETLRRIREEVYGVVG